MFRWYHNAYICIVHLASSLVLDDIPADEWFTRGWTLQELLAPENMKFYNREWRAFTEARNDKEKRNDWVPEGEKNPVWRAILAVTRIPSSRLCFFSPGAFDVAQRLSWAAGRRTTRIEDMAYALVGIFGIQMPVQYGEGKFAFQRLTEALLQRVHGHGIFIWTGPPSRHSAALPASIEGYLAAREAEDSVSVPNNFGDPSMMFTHKGLQVEVLLVLAQCREAGDDRSKRETSPSPDVESSDRETDLEEHRDHDKQRSESDHSDLVTALTQDTSPDVQVSDRETDPEERSDRDKQSSESDHSDFVTALTQNTHSPSENENDDLETRFLDNDEEYQPSDESRFFWFHLTDPDGVFKPLSVRGRGPIVFVDDPFTFPDTATRQYALAILDYHRDWRRGLGCVYVPYPQKSKYLAFVLYRDDPGEVWDKLQTDALVYVEVEAERVYEGQTDSICL